MPYDKGKWTLLVEAGEGHVDLVTNSLADGTIDATEARSILTSAVALSALIAMAAGVVAAIVIALWAVRAVKRSLSR